MSAEAFTAVITTYADRVHDDVRRLGATPAEAAEILESSALDVLDSAVVTPADVSGVVGRWFAQARVLACRLVDADDAPREPDPDASAEAPEGLIRDTALDLTARRGLARLSARDRAALLLRDAYELPDGATAIALGLDVSAARALVLAARRRFSEVAEVNGPEDTPLLLRGLAILALPDRERDAILRRIERAAALVLPSETELLALAEEAEPAGGPSVLTIAVSLAAALLVGSLFGVVTAPAEGDNSTSATGALPPTVEPFDVRKVDPAFATPTATPSPTLTATPTSTATSTASGGPTASAEPTSVSSPTGAAGPATITLTPPGGGNCTSVRVAGRNFDPGTTVAVSYADPLGRTTPSRTSAPVGPDGRFTARFAACDPNGFPGPHRVRAQGGGRQADATFTATS